MAFSFNGSNQLLRIGSSIVSGYPLTLHCIIKPTSAGASFNAALTLCQAAANDDYLYLGFRNLAEGNRFTVGVVNNTNSTSEFLNSPSVHPINALYSLTGTIDSALIQLFVNGTDKITTTAATVYPSTANRFSIGGLDRLNPAAWAPAEISESAIWNVTLTDAEILSLARGFTPDQIRPQSLQFYAPLVRDLVDVRGGRTITNINSATVATHPRIIT